MTGVGGVFLRSPDPVALQDWYVAHLGLPVDDDGYVVLRWGGPHAGSTVWASFPADAEQFGWGTDQQVLVNLRVDDLDALLDSLRAARVTVTDETIADDNGRFAHVRDLDDNLVQLWEPNDGM